MSRQTRATSTSVEAALLQVIRLKGRASAPTVASALCISEDAAAAALGELVANERAEPTSSGFRLTDTGRAALAKFAETERESVDDRQVAALYESFCPFNVTFKEIITAWQMKSDSTINDHEDAEYDSTVIRRLGELHTAFVPIIRTMVDLVPRLSTYSARFNTAMDNIRAGGNEFVARPMIDSYHTVWFELHEELIQVAGLNRADEAAAGRA